MKTNSDIDTIIISLLASLRNVPQREPRQAARTRAQFLQEANQFIQEKPIHGPSFWLRMISIPQLTPAFKFSLVLLIVGILLGAGTLGVVEAQQSLPGQVLYPLKTWSEDLRLSLQNEPTEKINLGLEFSNRRVDEMLSLLEHGNVPTPAVLEHLNHQLDSTLATAAGLSDTQTEIALVTISQELHRRTRQLDQAQLSQATPETTQFQARLRSVLMFNIQLAETGARQPAWLREHFKRQNRFNESPQPAYPQSTQVPTTTPAGTTTPAAPTSSQGNFQKNNPNPTQAGNGNYLGSPTKQALTAQPGGNGYQGTKNTPTGNQQTPSTQNKPDGSGGGGTNGGPRH